MIFSLSSLPGRSRCDTFFSFLRGKRKASLKAGRRMLSDSFFLLCHSRCGGAIYTCR